MTEKSNANNSLRMVRRHFVPLAAALMILLSGTVIYVSASDAPQLFNVQVFVTTAQPEMNYYYVTAYNSTGSIVVQSQGQYPGFGLELPKGSYLLAVTAIQQGGPICVDICASGSVQNSLPVRAPLPEEYGYKLLQVNGPATTSIQMENVYNITQTKITIQVYFENGTPAEGAQVYASVVGQQYYYPYYASNMYGRTNSSGVAVLKVPSLPVEVYAWDWVAVNLPKNITTVQTIIGGEPVNVTVYWQPTYVGLAGNALVIPPADQATITLKVQRQDFWAVPLVSQAGASSQVVTPGSESSTPQGVPAMVASQLSSISGSQYVQPGGNQGAISQLPAPSSSTPQTVSPGGYMNTVL
ncbi:MAG: hypothetical protein JRN68_10410, partial [Nitrososphaerota archaeon]|nr:hypothetical protein [Nitrososphaerota archaeon]